tara:strand:+ start:445 stop:972 length:528 start_codon:yes stop_codon:yes gene_type:complete
MYEPFFTEDEAERLQTAVSYEDLAGVAMAQLRRLSAAFPIPSGIVCGPISNGGLGSKEANIAHFEEVVRTMVKRTKGNFFSQIPYEEALWRVQDYLAVREPDMVHPKGAGNPLLEKFYRPLFESGLIGAAFFIEGWESSDGAVWEHKLCEEIGLGIWHFDSALNARLFRRNTNYM